MKHVDSTGLVAPSIDCDALLGVVTGAQTGAQESHLLISFVAFCIRTTGARVEEVQLGLFKSVLVLRSACVSLADFLV